MTHSVSPDIKLPRTRRAHKQTRVVDCLRNEIVEGGLRPGQQIATFDQMEKRFEISRGVLRQAVGCLKQDGFVESIDRQGLYVAARPPHLNRYGLIFHSNPAAHNWSRLFLALSNEAQRINHSSDGRQIAIYHDIHPDAVGPSFEQLRYDVAARRLAGVIMMPGTHQMSRAAPLHRPDLPKVHLLDAFETAPSINSDELACVHMALDWLQQRQRRRPAMLISAELLEHKKSYLDVCEQVIRRTWIQPVSGDYPHTACRVVELLLDQPADKRPDALWIRDDNFVSSVLAVLNEMGLRIGHDIDVLADSNFPWPVPTSLPVKQLGYDVREFLEAGINNIDQQMRGESVPDLQYLKPLFAEDMAQRYPVSKPAGNTEKASDVYAQTGTPL